PFGPVELERERSHCAAVELQRAVRVAPGGEQEHRAADCALQLVLAEGEAGAGDPGEHGERIVAVRGRLDLLEPGPGQDDVAGRNGVSTTASPAEIIAIP